MKKDKINVYLKASMIFSIVFVLFLIGTLVIDVTNNGVDNTNIGFSTINLYFKDIFVYNHFFYMFTQILGYLSIFIFLFLLGVGMYQLIKYKGIQKVDKDIVDLGFIYITLFLIYVLFELICINYRPIDMGTNLEASFPSSHTMLVIVVFGTLFVEADYRIKNKNIRLLSKLFSLLVIMIMITFRLLSGVHWFTDIIAGIIIGVSLVLLFKGLTNNIKIAQELSE